MVINSIVQQEYKNIVEQLQNEFFKLQNKSVLISGATGLIGSYLIDFLLYINDFFNLNMSIFAISRSSKKLEKRFGICKNLYFIEQDLNKTFKNDNKYNYVIHAASNAHPLAFSNDPVGTMVTNFIGTINLLECTDKSNGKFLYLSTGEIYGNNTNHPFKENDLGLIDTKIARSCYPESKRAAETLCMSYNAQYGINVNIARLCYVYGPTITDENSRADAQFLKNALNNEDIIMISEGKQKRTYCYVADAVCGLLFILLKGKKSEVYNIANKNSIISVKEYASVLANIAQVNLKFELPDNVEMKGYSKQADSVLDGLKLEELGWKPKYNITDGLINTYKIKRGFDKC